MHYKKEWLVNPELPEIELLPAEASLDHHLGELLAGVLSKGTTADVDVLDIDEPAGSIAEELSIDDVVRSIDTQGYVRRTPKFEELVFDSSRTGLFTYKAVAKDVGAKGFNTDSMNVKTMSEYDGLRGLYAFLADSRDALMSSGTEPNKQLATVADGILSNLTFIGEKEMLEATAGIAEYWKYMLREDPDLQLCIFTEASSNRGEQKSDRYILKRIIDNFSEEDAEEFQGRVVLDIDKITADPENTKIILLDDWSVSGGQLRRSFGRIVPQLKDMGLIEKVEAHLLTASSTQIDKGVMTTTVGPEGIIRIPIKSYYLAHNAPTAEKPAKAIMSGTHSAVNYDFEIPIHNIVRQLRHIEEETGDEPSTVMPPLTNIGRPYRINQHEN